jgi:hypothetical protein
MVSLPSWWLCVVPAAGGVVLFVAQPARRPDARNSRSVPMTLRAVGIARTGGGQDRRRASSHAGFRCVSSGGPVLRAAGSSEGTRVQVWAGQAVVRTVSVAVRADRRMEARGHGNIADSVSADGTARRHSRSSGVCEGAGKRRVLYNYSFRLAASWSSASHPFPSWPRAAHWNG